MNCWEFMKCGRIPGGENEDRGICPAYPDHGRMCAHVDETMCQGPLEMAFSRKAAYCTMCEFYLSEHHEQGEPVDAESSEG